MLSQAGLNGWPAHEPRRLQAKNCENLRGHRILRGFVVAPGLDELSTVASQARDCDHRAHEGSPELPHEWRRGRQIPRHARIHDDSVNVGVGSELFLGLLDGRRENQHHFIVEFSTPPVVLVLLVFDNEHFLTHLLSSFQRAFGLISSGRGAQISFQVIINYLGRQERQKIRNVSVSNFLTSWIKKFSSPKIKIWFGTMFLTGSFAVLSGAAPPPFRIFAGGIPRRLWRRNAFGLIQEYCTK